MKFSTKKIAYTALMTSLVIVATVVLGISNGETYTNLGDTVIFLTAVLLGPLPALIAGGLGSFFADMMVFPLTMWVTLIIKGLEGLICGLLVCGVERLKARSSIKITLTVFSMILSGLFMMGGYFIAEAFIYGTIAGAVYALTANAVQAAFSTVLATVLIFGMKLIKHKVDFGRKKSLLPHTPDEDIKTEQERAELSLNIENQQAVVSADETVLPKNPENNDAKTSIKRENQRTGEKGRLI